MFELEQDFDSEDEELIRKEVISRIAASVFMDQITDDNPSNTNGLSSLEQLIYYEFDLEDCELEGIKKEIYAKVLDLRGGSDMFDMEDLEF